MRNTLVKSYLPWTAYGEARISLAVGNLDISLGEMVDIVDASFSTRHQDQFVLDVSQYEIKDLPDDVIQAFGFSSFTALRRDLSGRIGTGLPAETLVTVVITGDPDAETPADAGMDEEFLALTSDDDIPELVFPIEDKEDVDPLTPEVTDDEEF